MKKTSVFIITIFFFTCILSSQSLVELSKKEKERRAKLKGDKIIVLTAKSAKNQRHRSSVIKARTDSSSAEDTPPEESVEQSSNTVKKIIPKTLKQDTEQGNKETKDPEAIENKWKKAEEYVQLLTLKMNALWQEFYSMNDMRSRDEIQRQIAQTYQQLQQAQEEEKKIKAEKDAIKK